MKRHFPVAIALASVLLPVWMAHAADDPPADPTLARDQAKSLSDTVKHNAKVVADAAKHGAKQVAVAAKQVAHEVAATSKEGAREVAATAKRGTANAKAAVSGEKKPPVSPGKAPAP
jgi:hypothetical protein